MHHPIQPFEMMDSPLMENLHFIVKMEYNVLGMFSIEVGSLLYCILKTRTPASLHQILNTGEIHTYADREILKM